MRRPDGGIETKKEKYEGVWGGRRITKLPFVRGVFNFIDSMVLGMQTLTWSAGFYEDEEAEETKADKVLDKATKGKGESVLMGLTVAFSIVMAVAIFILLPYFLSSLFSAYIRSASLLAVLEGVVRILIFVGYVAAISAMKDIRRVYMYHSAEHKCINCLEKGRPLTVKNVKRSSRQHKRCGTSFLLFVMFVSVVLFMLIRVDNGALRVILRILLLPVVAGISYEIIRLAGRSSNLFVRIISAPGMWLQKLTTKEPDEDMIEVAIASVESVFDWKTWLKTTFGYDEDENWLGDEERAEIESRECYRQMREQFARSGEDKLQGCPAGEKNAEPKDGKEAEAAGEGAQA